MRRGNGETPLTINVAALDGAQGGRGQTNTTTNTQTHCCGSLDRMQIQIQRNWNGNKSFIQTIELKGKYAIAKKEFVLIVLQAVGMILLKEQGLLDQSPIQFKFSCLSKTVFSRNDKN